jgi:hypothetical protein
MESELADLRDAFGFAREHRSEDGAAVRAAPLVLISGVVVLVLAAATLAWLGSVIPLRWKENGSSLLNCFASVASVAPPLLLLASLSLYGAYYPYIRHIDQFESAGQLARDVGPLWETLAGLRWEALHQGSWPMMLWPTVWCVVVAVIGIIILRWVASGRHDGGLPEE